MGVIEAGGLELALRGQPSCETTTGTLAGSLKQVHRSRGEFQKISREVDVQVLDCAGGGVVKAAAEVVGIQIADPKRKGKPIEPPQPAPLQRFEERMQGLVSGDADVEG